MRIFLFSFLLSIFLLGTNVFAIASLPKEIVSIEPLNAAAGENIVISAFLYNDQKETITFTLEAKGGDVVIGKSVATLAKGSAKTVTFPWKQPKNKTTVSVNIVSALTTKKVDMVSLHGSLGVLLVGQDEIVITPKASEPDNVFAKYYYDIKKKIEDFRIKQADYFISERDKARAKIDEKNVVVPEIGEDGGIEVAKVGNPTDYGMLVLSSALAPFFSSTTMFYAVVIIILFLLIRLLFRAFI